MKTDPNDSAFPATENHSPGITIRAHLAGLAMQGLLAAPDIDNAHPDRVARGAVEYTDALIAQLNADVPPVSLEPSTSELVAWSVRHGIRDLTNNDLRAAFMAAREFDLTKP